MQSVLKDITAIPGIIGGLISDSNGALLAHSFPQLFDLSDMQAICGDVSNCLAGMQDATGSIKLLDLRYEHGRVIVRQMPKYFLLLLCDLQANLPLLLISINVSVNTLKPIMETGMQLIPKAVPQQIKEDAGSKSLNKIVEASIASGMI